MLYQFNVNKYGAGLPRHYNVVLAKEGVMKKAFLLLAIIVAPLALAACGGNCDGVLNTTVTLFPNSSRLQVTGSFNAGHMLNYHYEASSAFDLITSFLEGDL